MLNVWRWVNDIMDDRHVEKWMRKHIISETWEEFEQKMIVNSERVR